MKRVRIVLLIISTLVIFFGNPLLQPSWGTSGVTFVVNTTGDDGDINLDDGICSTLNGEECTLRAAIQQANHDPITIDKIVFDIQAGLFISKVIKIGSELPEITSPLTIQGPNITDGEYIILNGQGLSFRGIEIVSDNVSIDHVVISNFGGPGLIISKADSVTISTSTIGYFFRHEFFEGNSGQAIFVDNATNVNIVMNKIYGNRDDGILIQYGERNTIRGNVIGFDVTGIVDQPNWGSGIRIVGSDQNTIGGNLPEDKNTISGNNDSGIVVEENSSGTIIIGNRIGTNIEGTQSLGNQMHGIAVLNSFNTRIGNEESEARNIISGNGFNGVFISGGAEHVIFGNLIGTDPTGTIFLANQSDGILIENSSSNIIGGSNPGDRNIISGNNGNGIKIGAGATGNLILGNAIGTDVGGVIAIPNNGHGICLEGASSTQIGGSGAGEGNLISGNVGSGIWQSGANSIIQGNIIGLNVLRTSFIPNGSHGIAAYAMIDSKIGGVEEGARNSIAGNPEDGVAVYPNSVKNQIIGNAIYDNGGLGINLLVDGEGPSAVTPNDKDDWDTGANQLHNYPEITRISYNTEQTSVTVGGHLNSLASADYTIHFYGNETCDPSGYGEGQVYLGMVEVTTGSNSEVAFLKTLDVTEMYDCINVTATDNEGNTSEFSEYWDSTYEIFMPIIIY